ncbi:hypothetical protein KAR91_10305 [Candidatus Pacearchaeota archaeon]|nr:hypothetical protein [Candidatus Pacearchaeota archaeon]
MLTELDESCKQQAYREDGKITTYYLVDIGIRFVLLAFGDPKSIDVKQIDKEYFMKCYNEYRESAKATK